MISLGINIPSPLIAFIISLISVIPFIFTLLSLANCFNASPPIIFIASAAATSGSAAASGNTGIPNVISGPAAPAA